MSDDYNLGQEFFRWEIATAVAGSIIGINAFNQPDVEASKIETRKLTTEYEKTGSLPAEKAIFEGNGTQLFADPKNATALAGGKSLTDYLRTHLSRIGDGDYFAVLGYVEMNEAHEAQLQEIRHTVRDAKHVATCLGFGPRFLHSTGQAYKGGPNTGGFLQITCDDAADFPVPGHKYSFGIVKAAEARGDLDVLIERAPRVRRVQLPAELHDGLARVAGDIISDGGNSFYKDDVHRSKALAERGIEYVDVGTSGGVWGLERGYCMMIGGSKSAVEHLDPIFATLAPGVGEISRTQGRKGEPSRAEQGYLHCGPSGAGHFVKMIHNGIEYGMMQAYAEGFDILKNAGNASVPENAGFDVKLDEIAEVWRRGSVVSSWLLDLTA